MSEKQAAFYSIKEKRRILIIEDDLINREILGYMLRESFELIFAENGRQALEILKDPTKNLSLVLLDLNLPDMSGMDILRLIKEDARTVPLPVIVMTADSETEVECLSLGATDFISKPYPKQEIVLARIQRTIELFEDRDTIRLTERDQLTGLYNREFFYHYASQFDAFHAGAPMDAVVLNINHFRLVNERYGREFGNAVLKRVAESLLEAVSGSGGIVCRREADTFLIYCPHRNDYGEILEKVCVKMEGSENYCVRVRMGVYSEADRGVDVEQRFDRAKQAADAVKNSFSRAVHYYDESMREKELYDERLLEDFHTAIREKQFTVHYQPKLDVRSQTPVLDSAEALVRWRHPTLGMISPSVFIPLFEANGLIRELDSYVWRETAAQIREWKKTLGRSIPVSVNVSRVDLYDPKLMETLSGLMEEYGLLPGELHLEITESAYTDNSEQVIERVSALRQRGFVIEMDDFGTGYSSLNMITTLPIDALKLDMQFIRTAFLDRKDTRLLEAVIGLAKSLNLPTIAEGVETAEQMLTLKAIGCDIVQGYFFSRPLRADEFERFVQNFEQKKEDPAVLAVKKGKKGPKDRYTYDAMHDPLTGLYNHSAFDILLHDADQDNIAVILATVDNYRTLSAEKGKECAGQMLRRVAEVLRGSFRSTDDICRLQEDEFAIIMSRITGAMQELVLEKIEKISKTLTNAPEGQDPVLLSVGVAFSDRTDPQGDVFENAETALRRMKQMRQDACVVY